MVINKLYYNILSAFQVVYINAQREGKELPDTKRSFRSFHAQLAEDYPAYTMAFWQH